MLALLTNDDGIKAEGLQVLYEVACKFFDRVVVVAPRTQKSAISHAITINRSFRVFPGDRPDWWAVEANPSDCIFFGLRELLDAKPDFVLSGINLGPNVGYDTIYSGTVAAAREGLMNGVRSLAFSLAVTYPVPFEQAKPVVEKVLKHALDNPIPGWALINVNIPSVEMFGKLRGYRLAGLGTRVFAHKTATWRDPMGNVHGWIGGKDFIFEGDDDSDCRWLSKGYVTLTPLAWNHAPVLSPEMSAWVEKLNSIDR